MTANPRRQVNRRPEQVLVLRYRLPSVQSDAHDVLAMAAASAALTPQTTQAVSAESPNAELAADPLVSPQTSSLQVPTVSTPFSPLNQQTRTARTRDAGAVAAAQLEPDMVIDLEDILGEELDATFAAS